MPGSSAELAPPPTAIKPPAIEPSPALPPSKPRPRNRWTPEQARSYGVLARERAAQTWAIRRATRKETAAILATHDPNTQESRLRELVARLSQLLAYNMGTERGLLISQTLRETTQALRTLLAANREAADLAAIQARGAAPASAYLAASLDPPKTHP